MNAMPKSTLGRSSLMDLVSPVLLAASFLMIVVSMLKVFGEGTIPQTGLFGLITPVPTALSAANEANPVQRIYYFHVPSAIMTGFSVGLIFVCSILYLWTRKRSFDFVARAATELGILFCTIVLVTGPIWAKPEWGRAWTWEPRLNFTAVLWLILAGSVLVRTYSDNRDQAARFAAALGTIAMPVVYLTYTAVERWGGLHPTPTLGRDAPQSDPRIVGGFLTAFLAFTLFYTWLLLFRTKLCRIEDRIEDARAALDGEHA
jgi:heme exporter protein C